jgi:hypothetical protein
MNPGAIFGINVLMSLTSAIVAAALFAWPRLRVANGGQALLWLVAPHMFLRLRGLSFLVPGVVSGSLTKAWAAPVGYGDLVAAILAIIATVGLAQTAGWAIPTVWIFNVWGAADLLFGFYQGVRARLPQDPGALGAGYYLLTAIVPLLLVSHALIFMLLSRKRAS